MKQIYFLPRDAREATAELLECVKYLKSHHIDCYAPIPDQGYGSFWVEDHLEQQTLDLLSKAEFNVVSSN